MVNVIFRHLLSFMLLCLVVPSFTSDSTEIKKDFNYWVARADAANAKKNSTKALIALLRAEKGAPFFERFSIIKRQVLVKHPAATDSMFDIEIAQETVKHLFEDIPLLLAQFSILFCLFLLGFSFFDRHALSKKMQILLLFVLFLFLLRITHSDVPRGVILPTKVSIHSGPAENFPVLFSLDGAQIVEVLSIAKHFVKIKKGKRIGWCKRQSIEQI
jgi:hypothetical protein